MNRHYQLSNEPICVGDILAVYTWSVGKFRYSCVFHNGRAASAERGDPSPLAAAALGAAIRLEATFQYLEVGSFQEAKLHARSSMAAAAIAYLIDPRTIELLATSAYPPTSLVILWEARESTTPPEGGN